MKTNLESPFPSPPTPERAPDIAVKTACSVEGGCSPSHRAMRRVAAFIIGFLMVSLILCVGYLMWSHSL